MSEVVCACGSRTFWESTKASGRWKALIDSKGIVEDTDLDSLKTSPIPKTVICTECGKRNRNPRYEEPN